MIQFFQDSTWIDTLRKTFLGADLPGSQAQAEMSILNRKVLPASSNARKAGVLIALFQENDHWKTVLIQRPSRNINDPHAGQISLPGGREEAFDASIIDTALREAEEEVGILRSEVQWLGALTELYIPVSNYLVFPQVGLLQSKPNFIPQKEEVDRILEVDLNAFVDDKNMKYKAEMRRGNNILKNVPYFDVHGEIVWGATAMILNEFRVLIQQIYQKG